MSRTGIDYLRLLGTAAARLRMGNLPPEIVFRTRQRILDTLGCLVAGYRATIADAVNAYVHAQRGAPEATLLPAGSKTTVALAGFAHASCIHGLELSDVAPRGTVHPGNEIVPVALALAERLNVGGAAILPAVAAGYEVEIRLGRALFPAAFYRGWWTPGLLGAVGPAVTAAHMLGLDAAGIDNAIGIVLNLAPTAMERANEEGRTVKWLIGGQACATGVLAAEMAARGVKGMRDVARGWLPVVVEECHPQRLAEGITPSGEFSQWELLSGVVTKYYATVGPIAGPLDATFELLAAHGIRADDVVAVEADCMKRAAMFDARHPDNEITAQASLPYCLAAAIYTRDPARLLGAAFQPAMLNDPALRALEDRVVITENEEYEKQYPARSLARITIRLRSGAVHSAENDRAARGRYLTPTDEELEQKFRQLTVGALGEEGAARVIGLARRLETLPGVGALVEALRPQRR